MSYGYFIEDKEKKAKPGIAQKNLMNAKNVTDFFPKYFYVCNSVKYLSVIDLNSKLPIIYCNSLMTGTHGLISTYAACEH